MFNLNFSQVYGINDKSVLYQASSPTFDPSIIELFCSIYTKASLLILPKSIKLVKEKLNSYLLKHNVTILQVNLLLFVLLLVLALFMSLKTLRLLQLYSKTYRNLFKQMKL